MNERKAAKLKLSIIAVITILLIVSIAPVPTHALSYSQVILSSQPERYYRFNETAGSSATDTAHGWTATYVNMTLNQTGAIYDGDPSVTSATGTVGSVSAPVYAAAARSFACETWFYITTRPASNKYHYLCRLGVTEGWSFYIVSGASSSSMQYLHGGTASPGISVTENAWHYLLVQYNYATLRYEIYLDTALIASGSDSTLSGGSVSMSTGGGDAGWAVKHDEWAWYNRILSQAEMNDHYAAAASPLVTATPTITYTPSITPTATKTPTATPPANIPITLGSYQGSISLSVSAGEAANAVLLIMLLVGVLFAIGMYLVKWRRG